MYALECFATEMNSCHVGRYFLAFKGWLLAPQREASLKTL